MHLRISYKWSQIFSRFEAYEMPPEADIKSVLELYKLKLQVVGKSGDCLQEEGDPSHQVMILSNDL